MKPGCDANYFSGGSFILNTISIENIQKWQSAGLWIRIQAFVMDYLVILVYLALLTALVWTLNSVFPNISKALFDNPLSGQITFTVVLTMPVTLYFALYESSGWQATLGKRWKNLKVVYASGGRLSRTRAVFRTLLKFIPWELAHTCMWQIRFAPQEPSPMITVGFVLVWILVGANIISLQISPTHQALYDRLSGTYVVKILQSKAI